jgi:hypothetical protein
MNEEKRYWAVCPDCSAEINYTRFEYDGGEENRVIFDCRGECPRCNILFQWTEGFIFEYFSAMDKIGGVIRDRDDFPF